MNPLRTTEILDDKTTAKVVEQLQPILTDMIAMGLQIKQAHWNVTGPHFRAVHLHLDEIYEDVQKHVDTVAERIAILGVSPSGQAKEVAADTSLSPIPLGLLKDTQVIDLITDRLGNTCRTIRERMGQIEDADTVTADMLHQVLDSLEKHLWMMRSQAL